MATYTKFYQFVEDLSKGVHNFTSDATCTVTVFLTNSAPSQSNSVLADITEISYTNCSSRVITGVTCEQTTGIVTYTANDLTLTGTGGSFGPFRYVGFYNDDATGGILISWWDYCSSISVNDGETFLINVTTGFATLG